MKTSADLVEFTGAMLGGIPVHLNENLDPDSAVFGEGLGYVFLGPLAMISFTEQDPIERLRKRCAWRIQDAVERLARKVEDRIVYEFGPDRG